jgi:WD40 repeat protein
MSPSYVVSGSRDSTLRIWDFHTGALLNSLTEHQLFVGSVAVDAGYIISGSIDFTVRQWNLTTGELLRTLEDVDENGFGCSVNSVATDSSYLNGKFVPGAHIVAGYSDGRISVWDLNPAAGDAAIATFANGCGPGCGRVEAVAASPRGVFSGDFDGNVRLWDLSTGGCIANLEGHTDLVFGIDANTDSNTVLSSSGDGSIQIFDL